MQNFSRVSLERYGKPLYTRTARAAVADAAVTAAAFHLRHSDV